MAFQDHWTKITLWKHLLLLNLHLFMNQKGALNRPFWLFLSTEPFCAFTKKIPRETRDSEAATGPAVPSPARDTPTRNKDRSPSLTVREPRQNPTDPTEAKEILPPAGNTRRKQDPEPRAKHPLPPGLPQAAAPSAGPLPRRGRGPSASSPSAAAPVGVGPQRGGEAAGRPRAAAPSRPDRARRTHLVSAILTASAVRSAAGPPRRGKVAAPAHAPGPQRGLGVVVWITPLAARWRTR
ncbi:predicted GPI-anchored protein 58 [Corvus kubaryi]|uniref:predicted GPI-anchored protein 58 n=1 Tax=Corvus kubaryi TaxID=68294 RepID=UPI001C04652C|nr:predicted GPI-anchored protein 58 [Corvus kubaryi]